MKRLAIISSYHELCGNATYTEVLKNEFAKYCEVEVLPLKTDILSSSNRKVAALANRHIEDICKELKHYDYVNIQFEAGLYGNVRTDIIRRVEKIIDASPNLIFTMHRIDIGDSLLDKGYIKRMVGGKLVQGLKMYRQNTYMAKIYSTLISYLKAQSNKKNVNIMVHTKREKKNVEQLFGFKNVFDFPITFMNEEMRLRTRKPKERKDFLNKYGLKEDDKIIGLFGFISEYKGHETAIKALKFLPENYKIMIFGSQHPMSIMNNMKIDPYIDKLINLIEVNSYDIANENMKTKSLPDPKKSFDKRVYFAGCLNDEQFITALYCCDYAVLPYLETNQSGSGIASLVLESKIKSLYSNNKAFFELQKYYPNAFETFDIGNYSELAYKIMNYKDDYSLNIENSLKKYNLENNVKNHMRIFEGSKE